MHGEMLRRMAEGDRGRRKEKEEKEAEEKVRTPHCFESHGKPVNRSALSKVALRLPLVGFETNWAVFA